MSDQDRIRCIQLLESPFHSRLLRCSYDELLARVGPDGHLPESLTGKYHGMFPRTIGAMCRMLLLGGHDDAIARMLDYCLSTMRIFGLERVPHIINAGSNGGAPSGVDDVDQIDGQAHVLLAWGLLAEKQGAGPFQRRTWDEVATLMDRSTTGAYLSTSTRWRIQPGLVLNTHLEHSREGQYWMTYDILTQSFMCAALDSLRNCANLMGDVRRARLWSDRLSFLEGRIAATLTRDLDGRRTYAEMLLPTGRAPALFPGLGWLNLAPIASGWRGVELETLRDTIAAWHARASISWHDLAVTASDWSPGWIGREIYTKALGWDLLACVRNGLWRQAGDILAFLEQANGPGAPSEAFVLDPEGGTWSLRDRGNGEQTAWLCWAMAEARCCCGLPALPLGR